MPTYDYVCDACDHAFELFQSITAKPERTCPSCRKRKLRRLIGTGAAILIGGRSGSSDAADDARGDATEASPSTKEPSTDSTDRSDAGSAEKKISGSTSTPTHEAREGRGVGNLVDAARRQRKEAEATGGATAQKKVESKQKKSTPKSARTDSKTKQSKKTPKAKKAAGSKNRSRSRGKS